MTLSRRAALGAATLLATPPLLAARRVEAQAAAPPVVGPAFHRFDVGALKVTVVTDGSNVRPDATQGLVVNATPDQVRGAMSAAGLAGPAMRNPFNVTFVETPRGLVAIDVGTGGIGGPTTGALRTNMAAAGLDPERVVLIVHTHFHGDHIGGLTNNDGAAVFPRAQVAVPEGEWTFWNDAGEESRATDARRPGFANVRRRFAPYLDRLTRFAPEAEVAPGIRAVPSNGHSPGHTSFLIADGTGQALVLGDAITTPAFFMVNPDWYPMFDMDPAMAVATRKRLLDRAATERMPVVGYHFDMPATGRVERAGTGYRLVPSAA
ncbi:MBL fold metallo-hydrolase [Roseomonas fluvialis]|uniref:MBL fold metallo-hydrolase n=1 Tax=Roseomonas fluvialis TaxID=1750527 RepID=A0ABM7Y0L2_9PROT|nr:MBL fold metallo-hydrolase [Roseomonas fluvialis]BDG71313.1 MBL fold metallo-hydrolase [Roseomonas fluvialis]